MPTMRILLATLILSLCVWVSPAPAQTADDPAAQKLIDQARLQMSASRFPEAIELWQQVIPKLSGEAQAEANYRLGYSQMRRGKYDQAVVNFQKAIDGTEDDRLKGRAYIHMGSSLQLSQHYDEAIASYEAADAIPGLDPDAYVETRIRIGYATNKKGDPEAAVKAFERATQVEGGNPAAFQTALAAAGDIHQRQGKYREAYAYYKRGADLGGGGHWSTVVNNRMKEAQAYLNASREFYIEPYVSNVSDTTATVYWVSLMGTEPGSLTLKGGGETRQVQAQPKTFPDDKALRQTVALTDLKPYTLYEYTAKLNDQTASGSFMTARDDGGPIRFVTYGDTQTGWQYHTKHAPHFADEDPDFVLHVGDCVERGSRWDEWKVQMFDPARPFLKKSPIWIARGNHDGGPYFPVFFGREDSRWQSFRFGELEVFVLESTSGFSTRPGNRQLEWLEEELANSTAKWKVVALHHPMFHTAIKNPLSGTENFRPLIERLSPDLVVNGHYHVYTRLLPISTEGGKPLVNITTGGGGGMTSPYTNLTPIAAREYGDKHYCLMEIDGDRLDITVKDIEGQVIDTYTMIKSGDGYQPEVMAQAVDTKIAEAIRLVIYELTHTGHNRRDLTAVASLPESPGEPWTLTLDERLLKTEALPQGTQLIVSANDQTTWRLDEQSLDLNNADFSFTATPPADWEADTQRLNRHKQPDLWVTVNVRVGDRLFVPKQVAVTVRPQSSAEE